MKRMPQPSKGSPIERVQTGIRIYKPMVKVWKGFAEYFDLSLAEVVEGVLVEASQGSQWLSEEARRVLAELVRIYGATMELPPSPFTAAGAPQRPAAAAEVGATASRRQLAREDPDARR
jgi:hypothetical protein